MTTRTGFEERDTENEDMVGAAERNLARVVTELEHLIDDMATTREGVSQRARSTAVDLRKAIQSVFDERQRLEKIDGKAKHGESGALDLDAARAEIRSRIARLRER